MREVCPAKGCDKKRLPHQAPEAPRPRACGRPQHSGGGATASSAHVRSCPHTHSHPGGGWCREQRRAHWCVRGEKQGSVKPSGSIGCPRRRRARDPAPSMACHTLGGSVSATRAGVALVMPRLRWRRGAGQTQAATGPGHYRTGRRAVRHQAGRRCWRGLTALQVQQAPPRWRTRRWRIRHHTHPPMRPCRMGGGG